MYLICNQKAKSDQITYEVNVKKYSILIVTELNLIFTFLYLIFFYFILFEAKYKS